jgi:hypothetical protein
MNIIQCCEAGSSGEEPANAETPRGVGRPPSGRRSPVEIAGWLIPGFILAFLPKCPACLAAYVAIGTGLALSAPLAAFLRTALIVVCVVSLSYLATRRIRRLIARSSTEAP